MKKNKEWIFFALVSLFSFSSCIQDEILQSEEQEEKYIRINVPKLEKGTVSDLAALEVFYTMIQVFPNNGGCQILIILTLML